MAEAAKKLKDIGALVDRGGQLDEDVKKSGEELKGIKVDLQERAKGKSKNGDQWVLEGNAWKASIAYSPEFKLPDDALDEIEAVDKDAAKKLYPFNVVEAHHEFTGDEDAVKDLKKLDTKLYRKLFKRNAAVNDRAPDLSAIQKAVRDDTKKGEPIRALLTRFVKEWLPKSVTFTRLKG